MRERAMILSSKLINLKKEPIPLQIREMPDNLLNPDMREIEDRLPPEINMMYKTVRVFGHFDKPVFLSLCKVCKLKDKNILILHCIKTIYSGTYNAPLRFFGKFRNMENLA